MDRKIQQALESPIDYSNAMTSRTKEVRERLEAVLSAPVEHNDDMNYSAAQRLVVYIDAANAIVVPNSADARGKVVVFLSSRSPLFTTLFLTAQVKSGRAVWHTVSMERATKAMRKVAEQIASELARMGYEPLFGTILDEMAEGHVTEMDGVPASVFQVLFSEVI